MGLFFCGAGAGNGTARGAASGMGRGDPGGGPRPALGKAMVSWSARGRHHCALPVSLPDGICRTPLKNEGQRTETPLWRLRSDLERSPCLGVHLTTTSCCPTQAHLLSGPVRADGRVEWRHATVFGRLPGPHTGSQSLWLQQVVRRASTSLILLYWLSRFAHFLRPCLLPDCQSYDVTFLKKYEAE